MKNGLQRVVINNPSRLRAFAVTILSEPQYP